jgi:HAD superfamily hydrolase (TIGR01509 family)
MNKRYAYIFDFDGVLVNTMNAHFECYRRALEEVNVPIDKEQFYSHAGMTGKEQIEYFARKAGVTVDSEKVYARKREIWESQNPAIDKIDCNLQLLRMLKKTGCPVAIASGSSRSSMIPIMEEYNIEVDAIVTGEDVKKGKPSPDLFLCAANRLKVAPEDCIVVEDSDVGIQAAQAAGMKVMRFYDNVKI